MFGSDDAPLQESLADLWFARGALNGKGDHRFVRGRIAMLVWLPSLIVLAMLSVWLQNAIPIVVGIPALLIGMWLFVGRSERVAALPRRLYRG